MSRRIDCRELCVFDRKDTDSHRQTANVVGIATVSKQRLFIHDLLFHPTFSISGDKQHATSRAGELKLDTINRPIMIYDSINLVKSYG